MEEAISESIPAMVGFGIDWTHQSHETSIMPVIYFKGELQIGGKKGDK
jgi:hypothetical protein